MRIFIIFALSTLFLFNPLIHAQTKQHNAITQPIPIIGYSCIPELTCNLQ